MGRVIIFPTDTVYGIGTPIFDLEGIKRIYEIKNRPKDKPLACLCANINQIKSIAYTTELADKLIIKFLPGALTIILKTKDEVKAKIGYETIGVRIPNNPKALSILIENGPMLTTSVNSSGDVPLNEYNQIVDEYSDLVDEIYPTTTESSNISSTIISIMDNEIKIIREGQISLKQIEEAINNV